MGNKRKRSKSARSNSHHGRNKRTCVAPEGTAQQSFSHPVLSLYFTELSTLREYLQALAATKPGRQRTEKLRDISTAADKELAALLDFAVVGARFVSPAAENNNGNTSNVDVDVDVDKEIADATQSTPGSGLPNAGISQSDVSIALDPTWRPSLYLMG